MLTYSDNMSKHKAHVQEVLQRLCANRLLPELIGVSSTSPPVNTMLSPKASPWPHTNSRLSKIGLSPKRSKTFNPSSALPTSTNISFMDAPKLLYHSHASPGRVPLGTLLLSANWLLKHLKRLLPQCQSSPTGSQTPRS